jgi:hypothetical protein
VYKWIIRNFGDEEMMMEDISVAFLCDKYEYG